MNAEVEVWDAATLDAQLTRGQRDALNEVVGADATLREELLHLVRHLSANLGGAFIRAFVQLLGERRTDQPAAAFVLPALERVIGREGRRADGRHG